MNKYLENLVEVSNIDKEASLLEPQIKEIELELENATNHLESYINTLEELERNVKKAKVDMGANELLIQENNDKLEQIDKKMLNVRSERERRALDAENGLAREKIAFANEEIERLEKYIANFDEKKQEITEAIDKARKELEKTKKKTNQDSEIINTKLREIFNKKENLTKLIDRKVIIFYEKIRKWAKNTSIVPIYKQACGGCFIKINDKVYAELLQSDDITTCPHCGRILYIEKTK